MPEDEMTRWTNSQQFPTSTAMLYRKGAMQFMKDRVEDMFDKLLVHFGGTFLEDGVIRLTLDFETKQKKELD